jgi:hypothetical protein
MTRGKKQEHLEQAIAMAEAAGYAIWQTGGGFEAFGKLLKEVPVGDDVAALDILITTDEGCDIVGDPSKPIWAAGVNYQDPRGGDSVAHKGGVTLARAIEIARGYEARAGEFWAANFPGVEEAARKKIILPTYR